MSTARLADPMSTSDVLIARLAAEGITTDPASLARLAEVARAQGVSDTLVSVMVDVREPVAPRVRAFGRVSSRVAALRGSFVAA